MTSQSHGAVELTGAQEGPSAGFTLAETLIALVLVSLVMGLIFQGLTIGSRTIERISTVFILDGRLQAAERILRMTLGSAYPAVVRQSDGGYSLGFQGDETQLEYRTLAKPITGFHGIHHIILFHDKDQLIFGWAQGTDGPQGKRVLLNGLRDIKFAYFGKQGEIEDEHWSGEWPASKIMPQLIEIKLTFENTSSKPPVTIKIAPNIDVDGACIFEPLLSTCRGR